MRNPKKVKKPAGKPGKAKKVQAGGLAEGRRGWSHCSRPRTQEVAGNFLWQLLTRPPALNLQAEPELMQFDAPSTSAQQPTVRRRAVFVQTAPAGKVAKSSHLAWPLALACAAPLHCL